ncbi:hypothetical protein DAEQUDRAFT_770772 [Daedalea quercina L-15889]|uniref:Uncharacterized protein n=1 Tax=Daedalea quercina L-15889 TaxID=1314783 RepID=A0A165KKP7_9APHY|nr:hypothetical protein DAEQUDRAFT_770772 [Daedalea quercina L-15889]
MPRLSVPFLAVGLAALRGASAVYWQQFGEQGCYGPVYGNDSITVAGESTCAGELGVSVLIEPSGDVECSFAMNDGYTCGDFAYNVDYGCYNFPGTGNSLFVQC